MVHGFLEAETVVQLPTPPYSPYSIPCEFFFSVYFTKKTISPDVDINLKVFLSDIFSVFRVCLKVYLYTFTAWILRLENAFLSKENTSTG